jgi:Mg2+ and Co2+ transporter CorA
MILSDPFIVSVPTCVLSHHSLGLRLEKRSIYLRQTFESHQQDTINSRLAILTVFSAIFMPLTFFAGIYGMNFEYIPGLDFDNGYYIFCGLQAIGAVVMLLFFYFRGWFG